MTAGGRGGSSEKPGKKEDRVCNTDAARAPPAEGLLLLLLHFHFDAVE